MPWGGARGAARGSGSVTSATQSFPAPKKLRPAPQLKRNAQPGAGERQGPQGKRKRAVSGRRT